MMHGPINIRFFNCSLVNDVFSNWPIQQLLVDEENISCPSFMYFLNTNAFGAQETWHKWSCGLQALRGLTPMKSIFSTYLTENILFLKRRHEWTHAAIMTVTERYILFVIIRAHRALT